MTHPKCRELKQRYYVRTGWEHGYRHYSRAIAQHLAADRAILELGCGRTFPLARQFLAQTHAVFGVDPEVDPAQIAPGATARRGYAEHLPFPDGRFDVVAARSLLEHLREPGPAVAEAQRVLKPGGVFVFLTPSRYDYVSLGARLVPNRWHAALLQRLEARAQPDTFPTFYRANSRATLQRFARRAGLTIERLEYLHHHPAYFMFSPLLYRLAVLYDRLICGREALAFLRGWLLGVWRKPGLRSAPSRSGGSGPCPPC